MMGNMGPDGQPKKTLIQKVASIYTSLELKLYKFGWQVIGECSSAVEKVIN
jgi:hypothetical protein